MSNNTELQLNNSSSSSGDESMRLRGYWGKCGENVFLTDCPITVSTAAAAVTSIRIQLLLYATTVVDSTILEDTQKCE